MTPFITIVIPVYKVEKYLNKCVDSILAQSFTDFELLLVDDGSPDNSGAICDEYASKDSRVKVFHEQNGGVSTARNVGLDNAKGLWCCFVDSDDWVAPTYLENFLIEGMDDCQLLMQSFNKFYEKSRKTITTVLPDKSFDGPDRVVAFLENFSGVHNGLIWHRLFRLDIVREHNCRFPEGVPFAEDGWFFFDYMRYVKHAKSTSKVGYNYFIRSGSLTSKGKSHPFMIYHDLEVHYVSSLFSYNVPEERKAEYINFVRQYACRLWSGWYIDIALSRPKECNFILNNLVELSQKYQLFDVKYLPFFYEKIQIWIMVHLHGPLRVEMLRFSQVIKKYEMAVRRRLTW